MPFAFEKLNGLKRDALLEVVEPVLEAHRLSGVELIWRTDNRGWVLYLTVERHGWTQPGAGATLDDCSELSRDLSAALDVANLIEPAYRLEVGTPGLERRLYTLEDFRRFAGQLVRVKLVEPLEGQYRLRGSILEVDDAGTIQVETDSGVYGLPFSAIEQAQLLFEVPTSGRPPGNKKKSTKNSSRRRNQHRK